MTEENTAPEATANDQEAAPKFAVQRVYVKDLSFETPMGVKAFQTQLSPKVNQDLNTKTTKVEDGIYEVSLRVTLTVTHEGETVYLIEVEQAGLFAVDGITDQQKAQVFNTACPNLLFPYARETIDNTLLKGSFPPIMLPPINFDALFVSALQQQAQQKAEAASEESH